MRPMRRDPQLILERLRELRGGPGPDVTLASELGVARQRLARRGRSVAGLDRAWSEQIPPRLAQRVRPLTLRAGALTVRVADASTDYEFSQWLRSGGRNSLAKAAGVTIRRVRTVF